MHQHPTLATDQHGRRLKELTYDVAVLKNQVSTLVGEVERLTKLVTQLQQQQAAATANALHEHHRSKPRPWPLRRFRGKF